MSFTQTFQPQQEKIREVELLNKISLNVLLFNVQSPTLCFIIITLNFYGNRICPTVCLKSPGRGD